jgi:hypothetical protein
VPVIPTKVGIGPLGQKVRSHLQNNQSKKGRRHGLCGECLLSKHEVLSSKPNSEKKKNKNKKTNPNQKTS